MPNPSAKSPGIFISYRRDDSEGQAGRLFDDLSRTFGEDHVFLDVNGIKFGRDFRKIIEQNVADCGVLIALIGPTWLNIKEADGSRRLDNVNDYVRLEIAAALRRNIPVIPVLVRDARMPGAGDLPDDLRDLSFRNGLTIIHAKWHSDVALLIENLKEFVPDIQTRSAAEAKVREEAARREQQARQAAADATRARNEAAQRTASQAASAAGRPPSGSASYPRYSAPAAPPPRSTPPTTARYSLPKLPLACVIVFFLISFLLKSIGGAHFSRGSFVGITLLISEALWKVSLAFFVLALILQRLRPKTNAAPSTKPPISAKRRVFKVAGWTLVAAGVGTILFVCVGLTVNYVEDHKPKPAVTRAPVVNAPPITAAILKPMRDELSKTSSAFASQGRSYHSTLSDAVVTASTPPKLTVRAIENCTNSKGGAPSGWRNVEFTLTSSADGTWKVSDWAAGGDYSTKNELIAVNKQYPNGLP